MNDRAAISRSPLSPGHGLLLAFPFPLALGAMLSDWAYSSSYQVQWINFADWMVAGSLLGAGLALVWTIVSTTIHRRWSVRTELLSAGLLAAFFVVQFINALVHGKDVYATMPAGLILSVIATILALLAGWFGFSAPRHGDAS